MKKYRVFLGLLTIILGPLFNHRCLLAQSTIDIGTLDQFITAQMAVQRVPGLALAITQGDQIDYVKGYGTARGDQPVTPQTQFFIASLSKSFTALALRPIQKNK